MESEWLDVVEGSALFSMKDGTSEALLRKEGL
jgi:hypothetical protein